LKARLNAVELIVEKSFQQIYGDTCSDKNDRAREYRTQIDVVLIEPNNDVTHSRSLRLCTL
jgi:hypothetical protein